MTDRDFLREYHLRIDQSMDQIKTKTMAEIYLRQGHLREAYEIYKALSERDPSDIEIELRLKELSETLNSSPPLIDQSPHATNGKVHVLMKWLTNIRRRKRM